MTDNPGLAGHHADPVSSREQHHTQVIFTETVTGKGLLRVIAGWPCHSLKSNNLSFKKKNCISIFSCIFGNCIMRLEVNIKIHVTVNYTVARETLKRK